MNLENSKNFWIFAFFALLIYTAFFYQNKYQDHTAQEWKTQYDALENTDHYRQFDMKTLQSCIDRNYGYYYGNPPLEALRNIKDCSDNVAQY